APARVVRRAGDQRVALLLADAGDRPPEGGLAAPLVRALDQRAGAQDRQRPLARREPAVDVQALAERARARREPRVALQAADEQQRLVGRIGVAPAVDALGVLVAPGL